MPRPLKHPKTKPFIITKYIKPTDESPKDRAAKDKLIREYLQKNEVTKCPTRYVAKVE